MPIPVASLNHAVLYVRDATRAAEFYAGVFGFEIVESAFGGQAVFMRASGGDNHHDLGLFSVGPDAPRAPRGSTGCTTSRGRSRRSTTWLMLPGSCPRRARSGAPRITA